MPLLKTRTNYRCDVLGIPETGDTVGVLLKTGEYRYYPWRGFLEIADARHLKDAVPVKLDAVAYSENDLDLGCDWIELTASEAVQGCWYCGVVYGIMSDGMPRVIKRSQAKVGDGLTR